MRTADTEAKGRILDAAAALFYSEGVRAVGLQRVIDECGCGKNLLYTHFASKDDLVAAYLERMKQIWSATVERELALDEGDPAAQIIGVVRAAGRDVATEGYRGCPFLNAAGEYPDASHPVRAQCAAFTAGITATVQDLAVRAGLRDPQEVTGQLMLVINGLRASGADLGMPAVTAAVSLAKQIVGHAARSS